MAQYKDQITVRVWRNVKTLGKIPTSHFGHAAVTISGSKVPGLKQHISFWPGDGASKGSAIQKQAGDWTTCTGQDKLGEMNDLTALRLEVGYCQKHSIPYPSKYDDYLKNASKSPISTPRPGQNRLAVTDANGWPLWSQSAETKVALPGIGCGARLWGLSTRRMGLWWQKFQASAPYYQALGKQNCAGVALMGLKEGGSEAFVPCPNIKIYGEPVQVEQYAKTLALQLNRLEDWAKDLEADIAQAVTGNKLWAAPGGPPADGLWDFKRWKDESALGPLQPRSATIREVDEAVVKYHAANWSDKFSERYAALVQAFIVIVKHRQEKPDSQRLRAILRLGAQILAILRNPGPIW
jgi:hypothetical protein